MPLENRNNIYQQSNNNRSRSVENALILQEITPSKLTNLQQQKTEALLWQNETGFDAVSNSFVLMQQTESAPISELKLLKHVKNATMIQDQTQNLPTSLKLASLVPLHHVPKNAET